MRRHSSLLGWAVAVGSISACSIYGPDLTGAGGATSTSTTSATTSASSSGGGGGGSGGATTTSSSSSSSGTGGSPACTTPGDCPGGDTECHTRTCAGGVCGADDKPSGTALAAQTAGDCKVAVCDGNGGTSSIPDNNDKKDDGNVCTTDGCSAGAPTHTPVTPGTACTGPNGAKVCGPSGVCVECVSGANCASGVCKANICVAAQCNDLVKNGNETDVDCGGGSCPPCGFNKICGSDGDCVGQSCVGGHCAATCTDGAKNGSETDVDCGGACATKCTSGESCNVDGDCANNSCIGGKCLDTLLISEMQTRGSASASDEFIEIYNPNSYPVTFDSSWVVWGRTASSVCSALSQRFAGGGDVIPAHGHLLYASDAGSYDDPTPPDVTYPTNKSFSDSGQIVLLHNSVLIDSVCFYFDAITQANLVCANPPAMWFPCQGAVSNLPHNNGMSMASNSDKSIERKPGGAAGNGQSTGDNTADWSGNVSSGPQNLTSPVTP